MRSQLLMAAAVALTFSGAVTAGEMKGSSGMGSMDSSNPAEKGIRTPTQPNETQPGMSGSMKGDGMKKGERMKDSSKSRSSMGSDTMSSGNPAEKGIRTPTQPNETQPGMSGDMKGDGMKKGERMKDSSKSRSSMKGGGEMKGDAMSGSSMGKGDMSSGNSAEKGVRTPSQPNETQPGMGPNKK